ncbi:MAG: fibronectin type III domain-containing protein, partial [Trueperaceae bacterium]|nr:fibronectin type III domain-containing protein [Trueperaceae bacterium]
MHPIARLPSALFMALLLAVAAAQPLVSLPVEDVVDGPIAMSEVTATSATLLVTTHIDLACVVVFGEDEGFGQLALDADMGGGAHRDHRVLLRGLEPDTEYAYRLQGSAPDGSFFA